jgi:hypothetical protein
MHHRRVLDQGPVQREHDEHEGEEAERRDEDDADGAHQIVLGSR